MRRSKVLILFALVLLVAAACGGDDSGDGPTRYGGGPAEDTGDEPAGNDELFEGGVAILNLDQTDAQVAVGDTVVIELDENASVGDNWEFREDPDPEILEFYDETFASSDPEADGAGGIVQFYFQAIGDGGTEFTLYNCFRCDSEGESSETPPEPAEIEFTVEVTA